MSYTVKDLITIFRRETEDPTYHLDYNLPQENSLWSNYELIQLIDQAQKEFAERTLIFKDSTSFKPVISEDDPWIDFDDRILKIERAEVESSERILPIYTIEDFQTSVYVDDYGIRKVASWESATGSPQCLIRDIRKDKMRIYPIPEEDDAIILTVRRLPLNDIALLNDALEVPSRWQIGLLYYVRKEAYRKPLAMVNGLDKLIPIVENDWEQFLSKAESSTTIKTRGPGRVRYGGI